MRCALVFYLVVTIFVIVYSLPELCLIRVSFGQKRAHCRSDDIPYRFNFIPAISQNISHIDLLGQPLKQLSYNAFQNVSSQSTLSTIWLEHCQISHVDAGALLNLNKLTIIDLSHNDINQIDSKLFSHTKQITDIYMAYNKIEVLPKGLFQNLTLLKVVVLEHNRIRQVEWFSFKNTPLLWIIELGNNQIEFMSMLFKDKFDNLTSLWLTNNPWKCDCELGPLYDFLVKINLLDQYGLVCEKPPTLQGRNWSDISRDKFVCPSEDALPSQDSVMTSAEPTTITVQDDNKPLADYNGTWYQQVDIGIPQPPSNQNWILYTILIVVCVAAVIVGVVFVVRYTTPTAKRRLDRRTNTRDMDSDLSMRIVQSRAVSENGDSASNMDDVNEDSTLIHHYEIREATID